MQNSKINKETSNQIANNKQENEVCSHKKRIVSGDQLNNCFYCGLYISDVIFYFLKKFYKFLL